MSDRDRDADRLAHESLAAGDPTGWFERLYVEAEQGSAVVPWDRSAPNSRLVSWADGRTVAGSAVVVGCGYGADAEFVAGLGAVTTAFDVSATAVGAARARFPGSAVDYVVADLLALPPEWAFGLVVEAMTVQALPRQVRAAAIAGVCGLVADGGTLVVVASAEDGAGGEVSGPPWPLSRSEVESFAQGGLRAVRVDQVDGWWVAEFRR